MANVESAIDFGDLPTGWSLVPVRSIVRKRRNLVGTNSAAYKLLSLTLRGVIVRDLSGMKGKFPATFETYQKVEPGDLVLCMFDVEETPRTVGLSRHFGMITGAYDVYRSDDAVALEYLTRLLLVLDENKALAPLYRGLRKTIPRAAFESLKVPMPTKEEQVLIVRYLDHAELRIAKAIAAKQRMATLLDEAFEHERDRLLFGTQAETKVGTGIDWLEDAPAGWKNSRLKFVMREVVRKSKDGMETHLSMSQVHGLVPSATGGSKFLSLSYEGGKVCDEGEIVLNRLKAHLGVFAVSPCLGVVSPDYAVLKVGGEHDSRYVCALLRSKRIRPELRRRVTGLVEGFWRLYTDSLLDISVMLPPLEEQKVIVEALNAASRRLEVALAALRTEIALLKEYRTRLISDVVTGKLDVRQEAAKLPDIDPMELATVAVGENGDEEEATDGD